MIATKDNVIEHITGDPDRAQELLEEGGYAFYDENDVKVDDPVAFAKKEIDDNTTVVCDLSDLVKAAIAEMKAKGEI